MSVEIQWLGRIEYAAGLDLQNRAVAEVAEGASERLLLLEHEPVFTIGRTRDQSSLRDPQNLPHPIFETNRGGQATWHGPGQLVGYPILDLSRRGRDLHAYLRFLEDFLIGGCAEFGVAAQRRDGLTGVWVEDRKIASLGVGVRKWITMHGFALNVCRACLEAFSRITPCGIAGVKMTALECECGRSLDVQSAAEAITRIFPARLEEWSAKQTAI